jgi:transcriptional regulator with XRE-family HTH domain
MPEDKDNNLGRFATELGKLMDNHEPPLSIADLAAELGLTYEFTRKVVRGMNLPTKGSLIILANLFNVEVTWLEDLTTEDKMADAFGRDVASIMSNPDTKALIHGFSALDSAAQKEVLSLLRKLLKDAGKHKPKQVH